MIVLYIILAVYIIGFLVTFGIGLCLIGILTMFSPEKSFHLNEILEVLGMALVWPITFGLEIMKDYR